MPFSACLPTCLYTWYVHTALKICTSKDICAHTPYYIHACLYIRKHGGVCQCVYVDAASRYVLGHRYIFAYIYRCMHIYSYVYVCMYDVRVCMYRCKHMFFWLLLSLFEFCITSYRIILYYVISHDILLCNVIVKFVISYCITPLHIVFRYISLCFCLLHHLMFLFSFCVWYYTMLYYTVLYCITSYFTRLCYIISYFCMIVFMPWCDIL